MKANYNVTGNDRKALVAAIEKLTGDKAVYMRMPTCAYEIGDITVDKEGSVTCEDADKLAELVSSIPGEQNFSWRALPVAEEPGRFSSESARVRARRVARDTSHHRGGNHRK